MGFDREKSFGVKLYTPRRDRLGTRKRLGQVHKMAETLRYYSTMSNKY